MNQDHADWRPLEVTPSIAGTPAGADGLLAYLDTADVAGLLAQHRALLLRGFDVPEERLEEVTGRLLQHRDPYVHGNSPRTKVGDNIYTSTEFPPEYVISMHNELSYAHVWPSRLLFFCAQPAQTGGATPLVHGALWLESLSPELRAAVKDGVCYRQFLHGGAGLGKSWQETFETKDEAEVERFLAASAADWEWTGDGGLRISQTRPATTRHPVTGEEVWFCQLDQWHPATLGEETMRELMAIVPEDELPQSVTFADGSPIPEQFAIEVRDQGLRLAVDVGWQRGDVLVIDNVAVAHGRRTFSGSRRVLVSMAQ
ncbi:MAG TPA: TauD/TfdA family dioxygenase [Actinocrinis sp.]|nr:TauD/TfdA family dioxygenase [Actinocrinis sp.]